MLTRNRSFLASALCRPTLLRANVNLFDIQRGVPPALLSFNLARQSLRQSCEVRISSGGRRWAKCVIRVDGLHSQMDLSLTSGPGYLAPTSKMLIAPSKGNEHGEH